MHPLTFDTSQIIKIILTLSRAIYLDEIRAQTVKLNARITDQSDTLKQ